MKFGTPITVKKRCKYLLDPHAYLSNRGVSFCGDFEDL